MIKTVILVFAILLSNPIHAGSYGAHELLISPSVSSNGMGGCGVSHIDEKSMYFNPAALALFAKDNRLNISGYPQKTDYFADINFYSSSFTIPLQKYTSDSKFLFAVGGYYSSLKLDMYEETTELYPDGTGRFFEPHLKNCNLVLAFAYLSKIHFSVGGTIKKIKQNIFEVETSGTAFDFGLLLQYPIHQVEKDVYTYFQPALGVAIRNSGSDIKFEGDAFARPGMISNGLKLPQVSSLGITGEFGVIDNSVPVRKTYSFKPTFDLVKQKDHDFYNRFGFELVIYKAFFFRAGYINERLSDNITSRGFSFDTKHFLWMIKPSLSQATSGIGNLIGKRLSFMYSYAQTSDEISYHDLEIQIYLWE